MSISNGIRGNSIFVICNVFMSPGVLFSDRCFSCYDSNNYLGILKTLKLVQECESIQNRW